jgi:hypothetical protein
MSPSAFRVAHKFHVAAWTPETRLISALNSLADSISHVSLLARESDPARQDADRALKLLEAGEQILGRDVARNLSLPSYRYASQVHVASSEFPVPLTAAQRSFLSDAVKVMNAELRGHVEGSKPSYRADTSRQSQKPYAKDAFNRKSPLAGVPHARISIDVAILKDGQQFTVSWLDFERSGDTSALDFLLSADGELVIVKSDTVWGRGTRSVSARQVGLEWAKDVQRKIKNLMAGRVLKQRENDLLRQDRAKQDAEDVEREPANAQRAQQVAEKAKQLELQRAQEKAQVPVAAPAAKVEFKVTTVDSWENDSRENDFLPGNRDGHGSTSETKEYDSFQKVLKDISSQRSFERIQVRDGGKAVTLSWSTTQTYNIKSRGIYGLERDISKWVTVVRPDGQPLSDAEIASLKKMVA